VGKLSKNVSLFNRLKTLMLLPLSMLRSAAIVWHCKPDVVLGVGGYVTGPVLLAAVFLRCRTVIWEPNAYPGLANRWLSFFVDQCLVVFPEADKYLKIKNIQRVFMPVRAEIENLSGKIKSAAGLVETHLLVFGGSQGARAINMAFVEAVQLGGDWLQGLKIVHQTGSNDFAKLSGAYQQLVASGHAVEVHEYLHDMPDRLFWADFVISRAGASTVSELAAFGRAAILVPLPTAADDHQTKNAQALVNRDAAVLLAQNELTPERLIREIVELKENVTRRRQISENVKKFYQSGAAEQTAKIILGS